MKNFILSIIIIAALAALLQQFFPWWTIAIAAFIGGYIVREKPFVAFLAGFAGVFLLWAISAYIISHGNNDLLAKKVATLLPLKGNVIGLVALTGVIGGLVGAFAALTGRLASGVVR